jgi:6-phosphogluconolactonase (cycloisomerase 2 family)
MVISICSIKIGNETFLCTYESPCLIIYSITVIGTLIRKSTSIIDNIPAFIKSSTINNKSVIFNRTNIYNQPIISYYVDEKTKIITKNNISFNSNFPPTCVTINSKTYVYIISEDDSKLTGPQSLNVYNIATNETAKLLFSTVISDSYINTFNTTNFVTNTTIDLNNFIYVLQCTPNEGSSSLKIYKIDTENEIGNVGIPLTIKLPDYSYDMYITRYDNDYYAYIVNSNSKGISITTYEVDRTNGNLTQIGINNKLSINTQGSVRPYLQ